jgi:signal transduction histidine kinase
LNITIKHVLEDLDLEIENKQARIHVPPLPTLRGNKRQMQQLLENLMTNALKYSQPGLLPHIVIASRVVTGKEISKDLPIEMKEKVFHLIEVSDNGIGFDQKYADSIFNVFTRLEMVLKTEGPE